ncbi:MAG TPA: sugar phosphate nucleotidyltransferase [Vicinamibacterales bacterium]
MTSISHALVLAAGLGSRLQPLTSVRAKPAMPVAGEPIARRIIHWLVANGVANVTINLHHLPETITKAVGDGSDLGARARYSWEQPTILGSAGGPRQALDILGVDTFFLINGDTLTDLNLRGLAESHAESGARVTMALVPNLKPLQYSGIRLDEDGRMIGVAPRGPAAAGSFHFFGVQIASRSVFADLPAGQAVNSIGGCYDALLAREPGAIRGFVTDARYWDIGTVADYWQTSWAWSEDPPTSPSNARIHQSASVHRSILWDDVELNKHATIEECIVTDGVHVPAGTEYRRKILMRAPDGTTIEVPLEIA